MAGRPKSEEGGRFKRLLVANAVAASLFRMERDELDSDKPQVHRSTAASDALQDEAFEMARASRDPDSAVGELRVIAKGRSKELRRAAAGIRFTHDLGEDRTAFLANTYLRAAADQSSAELPTADQEAWFAQVDELRRLPDDEGFSRLARLQPGLLAFRDLVVERAPELFQRKDRYNHLKAIADERGYPFPFREDQPLDLMHFVASGLTPLVGTEAETAEPLLKTRLAGVICSNYLLGLVGVPP